MHHGSWVEDVCTTTSCSVVCSCNVCVANCSASLATIYTTVCTLLCSFTCGCFRVRGKLLTSCHMYLCWVQAVFFAVLGLSSSLMASYTPVRGRQTLEERSDGVCRNRFIVAFHSHAEYNEIRYAIPHIITSSSSIVLGVAWSHISPISESWSHKR